MNTTTSHRGGAAVGYLRDLDPVELRAVLYMRLWFNGPSSQAEVWSDFSNALGADGGRAALKSLEGLCNLCVRHGRRPLMRHSVECACLGADEACFANFVGYASEGSHEDALLLATTLVRPDMGYVIVSLAREVGLAFKRMSFREAKMPARSSASRTLH